MGNDIKDIIHHKFFLFFQKVRLIYMMYEQPQYNPYAGLAMEPYTQAQRPLVNQQMGYMPQPQQQGFFPQQRQMVDPRVFETPQIVTGDSNHKPLFSASKQNVITVEPPIPDAEVEARKRKTSRKKESGPALPIVKDGIERVEGEEVDTSTIYTYGETTGLLHETLGQIDAVNGELVHEFEQVKNNRTMKNKYTVLNNLSENIGAMISNRISVIKEINNCISKSNDMDYKKYKDFQAAKAQVTDDKYISDMYQAMIANPANLAPTYTTPMIDQSVVGSNIIRANVPNSVLSDNGGFIDEGYLNYIANLTPEQQLMRYENDPDVKQVVVYDDSTGYRSFQMMNTRTGEVLPQLPTYGDNIMEDTTLDLQTGKAKNLNLRETFDIVRINNNAATANPNITSQY
jgi:hypothetical protein